MNYSISLSTNVLEKTNLTTIISLIDSKNKNNTIKGIEIGTKDYEILDKISDYTKAKNLKFQCHIPSLINEEEEKKYFDDLAKISQKLNEKICVTVHSITDVNINESINKTIKYLTRINNYIIKNNYNIIISIENLNVYDNIKRINNNELDIILNQTKEIYFTYDIGHDLYDNKKISKLTDLQKDKLINIHIHDIKENKDHCYITSNSSNLSELKKSISNLKELNYQNNIVLEYIVSYYNGNDIYEKFENYLDSFNNISEILE